MRIKIGRLVITWLGGMFHPSFWVFSIDNQSCFENHCTIVCVGFMRFTWLKGSCITNDPDDL